MPQNTSISFDDIKLDVRIGLLCVVCSVAFKLYDLDGDGFVGRSDILSVLHVIMGKALSQTQLEQVRIYQGVVSFLHKDVVPVGRLIAHKWEA